LSCPVLPALTAGCLLVHVALLYYTQVNTVLTHARHPPQAHYNLGCMYYSGKGLRARPRPAGAAGAGGAGASHGASARDLAAAADSFGRCVALGGGGRFPAYAALAWLKVCTRLVGW
jgi:TPR repeat protein